MKIFKYPIDVNSHQFIDMPKGARVLCVQTQGEITLEDGAATVTIQGKPFIWAAVDETAPKVPRAFRVVGTGHDVVDMFSLAGNYKDDVTYVGTFQQFGGKLVWHLFDMGEKLS